MSTERETALNALDFIKGFKDAFAAAGTNERVSTEHMEMFFFIMTSQDQAGLELRRLQKALGYAQAKMHRTVNTLEKLGWVITRNSEEDARQKKVWITEVGMMFFKRLSDCLSDQPNVGPYQKKVSDMLDDIEQDAAIRAATQTPERTASIRAASTGIAEEVIRAADRLEEADPTIDVKLARLNAGKVEARVVRVEPPTTEDLARLRDALAVNEENTLEVGSNYVKTERGIVTFAVLMKRFRTTNLKTIAHEIALMDSDAYNKMLTPTPKTIKGRLEMKLKHETSRLHFLRDKLGSSMNSQDEMRLQSAMSQVAALEAELKAIEAKEQLQQFEREAEAQVDAAVEASVDADTDGTE